MIRELTVADSLAIYQIINAAAHAYKGIIPDDRYHEPYMPEEELLKEMQSMTFFGWEEDGKLIGVMGFQPVKDVTLIRHAYVLPGYQQKGIGTRLTEYMRQITKTGSLLVGTWADASWAIAFYQKQGFTLMPDKDELLKKYWNIPKRQVKTSVVLRITLAKS